MNVLVTGGTGFVGQYLCEELVDRGHDVTALARTPDEESVPEGVEMALGDVTAYDSMVGAFEGIDAVVNLVSPSPLFIPKGGNKMYERIHLGGTENCIEAAQEHDVERFIQISGLGADPTGETHYIRAKGRAENAVKESGLEWTIFRPSVIFGDGAEFLEFTRKLTPPVIAPLPGGGKTRFQPVYIEELVSIISEAVESDGHSGETYEIGGPETLTLAEIAKLIRKARGQSVNIISVPMALAGLGLTVGGAIPGFPMGRDQYRSLQFDNTTEENDSDAFGYDTADMKTLSAYLGVQDPV